MEKPKCKICNSRHYADEPHTLAERRVSRHGKRLPTAPSSALGPQDSLPVAHAHSKHCPTCHCTRKYESNAERQRAYRDRKRHSALTTQDSALSTQDYSDRAA